MHLIDSHAHLDSFADTPGDLHAILTRAAAAGIHTVLAIGIGDGPDTMHRALEIANEMASEATNDNPAPQIFASAGIHPQEAATATPEALAKLTTLAAHPRCIAIGEIGLDYYHADNPLPPIQHAAFIAETPVDAPGDEERNVLTLRGLAE